MQTKADIESLLPPDGMDNDSRQTSSTKRQKTDSIIGGVSSFADMNCHQIKELLDSHIDAILKPWKIVLNSSVLCWKISMKIFLGSFWDSQMILTFVTIYADNSHPQKGYILIPKNIPRHKEKHLPCKTTTKTTIMFGSLLRWIFFICSWVWIICYL